MAQVTSGSFETNKYQGSTGQKGLKLEWSRTSTSIDSNYSRIHWVWKGAGTGSTYHELRNSYLNINGTRVYTQPSGKINLYVGTKVAEGDIDIPHNADGTKTFSADGGGGVYTSAVNCTGSGSWELETIPRASTFSISGGTLNQTITISISRASSSFTHRVYCVLGNTTQTFSNSAQTSASGTLSLNFANEITNSTTATATMYVETYNNGTYIGSNSSQFTITVPSDIKPTISNLDNFDTSGNATTYNAYIQGKSTALVFASVSEAYSSPISTAIVNLKDSNDNVLATVNANYNSSTQKYEATIPNIRYVGSITAQMVVKDTRGREESSTTNFTVASYENPKIAVFTAERLNNDDTVTITYDATITNINNRNQNSKTFQIQKRKKGDTSWITITQPYTSAYRYNGSMTNSCDSNYPWEFLITATDNFTTSTKIIDVPTSFELINWGANGNSMAIGKVSEYDNKFEVGMDTYLNSVEKLKNKSDAGFEWDIYGNWKHQRNTTTDAWSIKNYNGNSVFTVYPETGNTIINGNNFISNDWAVLVMGRKDYSVPTWTEFNLPIASDRTFITSDSNLFEITSTGIQCNFTGAVVVIRKMCVDVNNEFDFIDEYGTNYMINGNVKEATTIESVSSGDIKKMTCITGVSQFTSYVTRMFVMRIQ